MSSKSIQKSHYYICLHLNIEEIDDLTRARLEQGGIECVQDGGPHCAYGIIDGSPELIEFASEQACVEHVEFGAPPVGF